MIQKWMISSMMEKLKARTECRLLLGRSSDMTRESE